MDEKRSRVARRAIAVSMPTIRAILAPIALLACGLAVATAASTRAQVRSTGNQEGLCGAHEEAVFACATPKGLAYVCGIPPEGLSSRDAQYAAPVTIQYRFGRPGKVEFVYPQTTTPPEKTFKFSSVAYSGGGEAHLSFENGGYEYILYDRMIAGDWDNKGHRAHTFNTGVLVRKGGRVMSNLRCTGAGDTMRAPAYALPKEPFDYDLIP